MQCPSCGSQQPEGIGFCQQCGTPIPPPPPSALAPTVAASQPSYGNPGPYTNYNPSSISGSGQVYGAEQNPYANTPYNPYGQSQPGNVPPPYPPAPLNTAPPYTPPQQGSNASYGTGVPPFPAPVPVKPKRGIGLVSGIIIAILVVVVVIGGLAVLGSKRTTTPGSQGNTVASTPTPTYTTVTTPSGNTIDPKAASIVTHIQMASAINRQTAEPTILATNFKTYSDMYSTFQFDFTSADVSPQNPGYVEAKYYIRFVLVANEQMS